MDNLKRLIQDAWDKDKACKKAAAKLDGAKFERIRELLTNGGKATIGLAGTESAVNKATNDLEKALDAQDTARQKIVATINGKTGWTHNDMRMLSNYALMGKRPR